MSLFKKFTDFCAGFAVFGALLYLLRSFMTFMKDEELSMLAKLKEFVSKENANNYRAYAILAILFTASLFIGLLLKKFPFVALAVSSVPMVFSIDYFAASRLDNRPMLFVALGAIHVVGCLFECIICDKEKRFGKLNCTFIAGVISTFACGALSIFTAYRLSAMQSLVKNADPDTFNLTKLSYFDAEIYNALKDASANGQSTDSDQLILLAVMYVVVLIVTLFIGEIFFIDLTFSLIPLVSAAYCYSSKAFLPQADMLVTLSMITTVIFFAATFFGTKINKSKPTAPQGEPHDENSIA